MKNIEYFSIIFFAQVIEKETLDKNIDLIREINTRGKMI